MTETVKAAFSWSLAGFICLLIASGVTYVIYLKGMAGIFAHLKARHAEKIKGLDIRRPAGFLKSGEDFGDRDLGALKARAFKYFKLSRAFFISALCMLAFIALAGMLR